MKTLKKYLTENIGTCSIKLINSANPHQSMLSDSAISSIAILLAIEEMIILDKG